jgi:anti-sigma factor RsiW
MTDHRPTVRDIDLMAYADGLLDADPKRKAEVEAYLRQHPEESARVRDYAAQNNAIRRLYSPVLSEPVPERLRTVLDDRQGRALGLVTRVAIAVGLMLVAGFTGWVIGQRGQSDPWPMRAFVNQMLMTDEGPHLISSSGSNRALNQAMEKRTQPLDWLSDQIAASLQVPDLTSQGFTLVKKRLVAANGSQAVQIIYATPSGRRLSLFLRTRWQDETPQFRFAENDGVTMVYWLEGPLAYALAGQLDHQEMMDVVQALRTSMRHQPQDTMSQIAPETASSDTLQAPLVAPTQPVPLTIPKPSKYP